MSPHLQSLGHRERGASLLVALVFLTVMATLGATLANVTSLEERMAGNTRDRDLALQATEAALADAATSIKDVASVRTAATVLVATNENSPAYWESCFENETAPCTTIYTPAVALPTEGPGAVAAQPQYVVERIGTSQIYRVTARGVGGSEDAVVVLQAEFEYSTTP